MRQYVGVLALVVAACKPGDGAQAPTPAPTPSASVRPAPSATARATASATSNGARSVAEETDDFMFEYAYPKEAGRIPELAAVLDTKLARTRADLVAEATAARRETRAAGFPYNKHSTVVKWKVVSDLPEWLSMSGDVANYSGGAHGIYGFDSLVWEKHAKDAFAGIELFQSPAALDKALGPKLCQALDKERAKRRGSAVTKGSAAEFDKCISVKQATVLVGSRGRAKFDRITVQFGPYVAGPYAEGAYELAFPVDRAVLAAVKPEFTDAFAARN
ncbi:MAG: DUF4163 domain-containing protein [Croceibacterium sp.]